MTAQIDGDEPTCLRQRRLEPPDHAGRGPAVDENQRPAGTGFFVMDGYPARGFKKRHEYNLHVSYYTQLLTHLIDRRHSPLQVTFPVGRHEGAAEPAAAGRHGGGTNPLHEEPFRQEPP